MPVKVYSVANWDRFVKADMTKCRGPLLWVATPTTHDGLGFLEMMTHPDGIRMYGAWHLILQTAAKCPTRGVLITDGGRPIGPHEIALRTRAPEDVLSQAFEFCERIGWLVVSGHHPDTIRTPSGLQDKTNKTVQDKQDKAPTGAEADSVGPEFSTREGAWRMSAGFRDTLAQTFPLAPLDVEIVKAATWTHDAPKKKTAAGMHRFLLNWLSRNYAAPAQPAADGPTPDGIAFAREEMARLRLEGKL